MANNRLYIGHRLSQQYTLFAKGFGSGWGTIRNPERIKNFLNIVEVIGESHIGGKTNLFLFTEYDDEHDYICENWSFFDED